jgi:hypothetical protein
MISSVGTWHAMSFPGVEVLQRSREVNLRSVIGDQGKEPAQTRKSPLNQMIQRASIFCFSLCGVTLKTE